MMMLRDFALRRENRRADMLCERKAPGYNEIETGDVFVSASRTVTEADVMMFAGLTGDMNEIHTSEAFAQKGRFGRRIAHGLLILSIANGLYVRLGIFENSVLLEIKDWKVPRPVFIGDTVRLRLTIKNKRVTKKPEWAVCDMGYEVVNQNEEIVGEGTMVRMVPVI